MDEFEKADITDKMDAGIGNYLPDSTDESVSQEGNDGLKTDIKINEISTYDGRVVYNRQYEAAESGEGTKTPKSGIKTGKKKRKKKKPDKISVVEPKKGSNKGVVTVKLKLFLRKLSIKEFFIKLPTNINFTLTRHKTIHAYFYSFMRGVMMTRTIQLLLRT